MWSAILKSDRLHSKLTILSHPSSIALLNSVVLLEPLYILILLAFAFCVSYLSEQALYMTSMLHKVAVDWDSNKNEQTKLLKP